MAWGDGARRYVAVLEHPRAQREVAQGATIKAVEASARRWARAARCRYEITIRDRRDDSIKSRCTRTPKSRSFTCERTRRKKR